MYITYSSLVIVFKYSTVLTPELRRQRLGVWMAMLLSRFNSGGVAQAVKILCAQSDVGGAALGGCWGGVVVVLMVGNGVLCGTGELQ